MIKDLKLGIALMRNGLAYDTAVGVFFLAVGMGVVLLILLPLPVMSGLYIALSVSAVVWQVYSTTISTMIQSSPYKKKLRTTIPVYIALIMMLIGNTLCIVMHWLAYLRVKDNDSIFLMGMEYDSKTYANTILICSFLMVAFLLFTLVSNIFYKISVVILLGAWIWFRIFFETVEFAFWDISIGAAVVLSYIVVLIGCVALYGLNCLLYKLEYSEASVRGMIKRAAKQRD